jgi:hypothetical protein
VAELRVRRVGDRIDLEPSHIGLLDLDRGHAGQASGGEETAGMS